MVTPQMQRLLNAIAELESNGLATRPWALAGRNLSLCQRCEEWMGSGCLEVSLEPGKFAEFLVNAKRSCPRWEELHGRLTPE
jgi:hypothetical protein